MPRLTKRRRQLRKKRGGGQETHTSTTQSIAYPQYGLPAGASSQREAALANTNSMNESQQSMIDAHGGRKRRKTRRGRKSARKNQKRKTKRKTRSRVRKTKRRNRHKVRRRRRMQGGDQSGQTVTVPSFSNSGSDVSSINANSMSQTSNSTNLNANSQASNDCYATGTCSKQSGGFRNHYEAFGRSFGTGMTGGKRSRNRRAGRHSQWGCMSGGKGSRDYNDKNRDPNRGGAHGQDGIFERMFGN